jgi:hypothetical protein
MVAPPGRGYPVAKGHEKEINCNFDKHCHRKLEEVMKRILFNLVYEVKVIGRLVGS